MLSLTEKELKQKISILNKELRNARKKSLKLQAGVVDKSKDFDLDINYFQVYFPRILNLLRKSTLIQNLI